ncbi:MAG: hypothetical protein Q8T09_06680 [Candidatus Melainabacteria bacterium]|nr:hypothetical protein [Candidatus Melainabacteria bacterium]
MRFSRDIEKALVIVFSVAIMCGCTQTESNEVTPQGTIALEKITLGVPESTLKEAMVTFVKDPSATANAGGKSQYLSREKTAAGGQYMVQCKDGTVFQISEIFTEPTSKEPAAIELGKLLPAGAPEQSRVEEKLTSDVYYYGSDYTGELSFKDAQKSQVTSLTSTNILLAASAQKATAAEKEALKPLVDKAHEPK